MNSFSVAKDNNTIINILHKKVNETNELVKLVCELKNLTKDLHKFDHLFKPDHVAENLYLGAEYLIK